MADNREVPQETPVCRKLATHPLLEQPGITSGRNSYYPPISLLDTVE